MWLLNSMQITSPDPILRTYIAHNPWLWLAWHIFLLHECAVLSFYACILNNHPSSRMNVELYNFTYLTFFPKYLCHLLMQVSLLLAFPIKLFIKSTPIILSRLLQTFLNSNWIRGTWHQKSLFSSNRDDYSSDPPSGARLGSIPNECGPPKKISQNPKGQKVKNNFARSDVYSWAPPSAYHRPPPPDHIPAS